MSDNTTKMICTTVVWIATAYIFVFGVFRFNYNGALAAILWAVVAIVLASGATAATRAIWRKPPS